MSMKECMIHSELSLHVESTANEKATLIQYIDKRGNIGAKVYYNGEGWYLQ